MDLLTASRLATFRRCPRQHYLRYELGLSRIRTSDALRIGSAYHKGLEVYALGGGEDEAIRQACEGYGTPPEYVEPYDWAIEGVVVEQLLRGYFDRYRDDQLNLFEVEDVFQVPLRCGPRRVSRKFRLAGKRDGLAVLPDERLALVEYKTTSEDIGPDSDYWLRLRCDQQIALYVLAARQDGWDVATVIYDAARKPSIQPYRATPDDRRKYKADGTLYANQHDFDEPPAMYAQRVFDDIRARPEWYFARREVPILHDELARVETEIWQQSQAILDARKHGRWYRNVDRFTCSYCQFAGICIENSSVENGNIPSGYEKLDDVHPELGQGGNHATNNNAAGNAADPADTEIEYTAAY